jgi:signal transduction histidine kinase
LLLDVARQVSSARGVAELLPEVCEAVCGIATVRSVELLLWDAERSCLRRAAARGRDVAAGDALPAGDATDRLETGEVVTLAEGEFAVPLVAHGTYEGALVVRHDESATEELLELTRGIAMQTTLALTNLRVREQQLVDAEVDRSLHDISHAMSACLDEEALWILLARAATDVLGLPWAITCSFDERMSFLRVTGTHGVSEADAKQLREMHYRLEECPVLHEAITHRALVTAVREGTSAPAVPASWDGAPWIAVPLIRGSWVGGVLTMGHFGDRRPITRRQIGLAEGLAHHASIALQNARLAGELEAADRLKSEFAATMSHELLTPLNVIIGYTEMLRDGVVGPVTGDQQDLIERLDARARGLFELIEATLHAGSLESGRDTLEIEPVGLSELIEALKVSTAVLRRSQAVAFEWEAPSGVHKRIMTDRAKISLVVRNLVSNAFKFTTEGKVVVRVMVVGDTLMLEVGDTGMGISPEHLPVIFDMFRQADGSATRRHGGVGLGLYIVREFVQRLGGIVDVTSTPGRGSRFRVVLPKCVREEPTWEDTEVTGSVAVARALKALRADMPRGNTARSARRLVG